MAMTLRLDADLEARLRAESEASGRPQQEIIRRALEAALSGGTASTPPVRPGTIPARRPYRAPTMRIVLPDGLTSADLLERDDRL